MFNLLKKINIKSVLVILISLTLTITMITIFDEKVGEIVADTAISEMKDSAYGQALAFNRELQNERIVTEHIASTVSTIGYNEKMISEYLENVSEEFESETVIVVDNKGVGITSNGELVDVKGSLYFEEAFAGNIVTTDNYISPYTGKDVIAVAAPIYFDGALDGVVAMEYGLEYFGSILGTEGEKGGYSAILDEDGEIIISSSIDAQELQHMGAAIFENGDSREDYEEVLASGQDGSFIFSLFGEKKFAEIRALDENNWYLVVMTPESIITETTGDISVYMTIVSVTIVILFLGFIVFILRSKSKHLKEVERIAYYDELTGLPNLVKFKQEIKEIMLNNPEVEFVIAKFDIVNFKAINELYDYETGNEVIKVVAKVGESVTSEYFVQSRIGADEFLIFGDIDLIGKLETTSEGYEAQFKEQIPFMKNHIFSFRYGRYFIEKGELEADSIVSKVTMAHNFAKEHRECKLWDYDNSFKERAIRAAEISNKMERALEEEQFKVFLQPKYSIANQKINGAEALVRWIEPDGNMIFPDQFLPLFESNGYITTLDKYMFNKACLIINEWISKGLKPVVISVNMSRLNMRNPNLIEELEQIAEKNKTPKEFLEIELTENAFTETSEDIEHFLDDVHNAGFAISIDDFGAGHSSLGMLKNYNVDTLKLDRSFFVNSKEEKKGNVVIEGIISLAKGLGMKTVAEGIEEQEQVDFLNEIGCESVQGYVYARPMPYEELEAYLEKEVLM